MKHEDIKMAHEYWISKNYVHTKVAQKKTKKKNALRLDINGQNHVQTIS